MYRNTLCMQYERRIISITEDFNEAGRGYENDWERHDDKRCVGLGRYRGDVSLSNELSLSTQNSVRSAIPSAVRERHTSGRLRPIQRRSTGLVARADGRSGRSIERSVRVDSAGRSEFRRLRSSPGDPVVVSGRSGSAADFTFLIG